MNLRARCMRSSLATIFLLSCLSIVGCAFLFVPKDLDSDTLAQIRADSQPYQQKGSGSIAGVVKIDTSVGTFVAAQGTQVILTPATRFALGRFQEYVVEKNELPEQRNAELVWFDRTDAAGHFRFQGLPPGDYLLASPLPWSPSGSVADARQEITYARVQLGSGEAADITVTRNVVMK